jgi:hypothetical protein
MYVRRLNSVGGVEKEPIRAAPQDRGHRSTWRITLRISDALPTYPENHVIHTALAACACSAIALRPLLNAYTINTDEL